MSFCEYTYEKLCGTHRRTSTALLFFLTQQIHRSLLVMVMVLLLIFAIFVAAKHFSKKLHCHFRQQHLPVVSSCFKISNDFYLNRKRNFEIEITQNAWMKHGTNDFIDVANAKIWRYEWIWAQNFFQCISNVFLVVLLFAAVFLSIRSLLWICCDELSAKFAVSQFFFGLHEFQPIWTYLSCLQWWRGLYIKQLVHKLYLFIHARLSTLHAPLPQR